MGHVITVKPTPVTLSEQLLVVVNSIQIFIPLGFEAFNNGFEQLENIAVDKIVVHNIDQEIGIMHLLY